MQRSRPIVVMLVAFAAFAGPAFTGSSAATAAVPLPAHIYAPYFETWTSDAITTTAQQSGARYFTLAFLETLGRPRARSRGTVRAARRSPPADT